MRPIIVEECPKFELRDGLFFMSFDELNLCLAARPSVFFAAVAEAVMCSRKHRPWDGAEIVDFHAATGKSSK